MHWSYSKSACVLPGEYVERQLCRDAILPMPAICEVPCPKDCALSPWTLWSLCSHTCSGKNTEGRQTRARSILAYNAGEGKNSEVLQQQSKADRIIFLPICEIYMDLSNNTIAHPNHTANPDPAVHTAIRNLCWSNTTVMPVQQKKVLKLCFLLLLLIINHDTTSEMSKWN